MFNDYPARVAIGEVWVYDNEQFARYVRPDELHLGFNFRLSAGGFRCGRHPRSHRELHGRRGDRRRDADLDAGQSRRRPRATRYGGGGRAVPPRAMALAMLALPGAVFIYNGEELGLPNVDLPDEALRDPVWERSGHTDAAETPAGCPCRGRAIAAVRLLDNPDTWLPLPPTGPR